MYLVTGKGGVGKTLSSLACARCLIQSGQKVLFVDFDGQKQEHLCQRLSIPYERLDLFESLERYIGFKLHSKLLGSWISGNKFFRSIIDVIPGMSYLIYLGHILYLLREDENLTIVLDSPSSGHALVMLESIKNYLKIFRSGHFFNDIKEMEHFMESDAGLRILISNIPTQLSLSEGRELKDRLNVMGFHDIEMFLNFSLSKTVPQHLRDKIPPYLRERISLEEGLEKEYGSQEWEVKIPYWPLSGDDEKIEHTAPFFKTLIEWKEKR
ncbi:MAG: AAA family ATPase [Bacteriovoracales bacterium]|nr:AAA family ATPase [Bacteriovoracales bacterium]